MKTFKTAIMLCILLIIGMQGMQSQEMKVTKYDNPEWIRVGYVKFKPMMKQKAQEIIRNYFAKADKNLGRPGPMSFELASGEYDMIVMFPMEHGIETLNYEMTQEDIDWMQEMSKLAGGPDKAMEKMQEFYSYVETWESDIARRLN